MATYRRRKGSATALLAALALAGVGLGPLALGSGFGALFEPPAAAAPAPRDDLGDVIDHTLDEQRTTTVPSSTLPDPGFPGDGSDDLLKG